MNTVPWIALAALAAAGTGRAQVFLETRYSTFSGGAHSIAVPDMNLTGASDTENLSFSATLNKLYSVSIYVNVDADFDGDIYAYVQHNGTTAILLNRPGRTASAPFGYEDKGLSVTFSDTANNGDIHTYQNLIKPATGTKLTGIWQPDGRNVNPLTVLATDQRTAFLNAFKGQDASGDWTLFVADTSSGGQTKIIEWGIAVTVVPEPGEMMAAVGLGLVGFAALRLRSSKA